MPYTVKCVEKPEMISS